MVRAVRSIVWMPESALHPLSERISSEIVIATSAHEIVDGPGDPSAVAYVNEATLPEAQRALGERPAPSHPVIAICDGSLQTAIGWLASYPWLAHVVSSSFLQSPIASGHLRSVTATLTDSATPRLLDWAGATLDGRRVRLARAGRRVDRLERMSEFLARQGVGPRPIQVLRDAAEELLTNAFYDAPVAAGVLKRPISRTEDVALPDDCACDMVYGSRDDIAVVRVRDPFGSLTRARLVEVLTRCARSDMQVEVDESMGGAGLGLWRIFSTASFLGISVLRNRYTEFLVGIALSRRPSGQRPFAFHLLFKDTGRSARRWRLLDGDSSLSQLNTSVTLATK
jgi:hypothetical protein